MICIVHPSSYVDVCVGQALITAAVSRSLGPVVMW